MTQAEGSLRSGKDMGSRSRALGLDFGGAFILFLALHTQVELSAGEVRGALVVSGIDNVQGKHLNPSELSPWAQYCLCFYFL